MAPDGVGLHFGRVPFFAMSAGGLIAAPISESAVAAFAEPPDIDNAVALLATVPVDVVGVAFTSASYTLGLEGESALIARLAEQISGMPITTTCSATVRALRHLNAQQVALVDPPWFGAELNEKGRNYYSSSGFDVLFSSVCDLPKNQLSINPTELYRWIRHNVPVACKAIIIGGNGFRSVGIIEALEEDSQQLVITANQAILWDLLRVAHYMKPIQGYGRLLNT